MFYIHGCSWQAGVCVCVYVALLWSRATWVCQHPARRSPRTRGCGGAGSCWHGRPVQRDGAGDVGREQNRAAFVLPSAEPGKTREPPVSACTSRQGGKWTYRCCTVLLRLWSVMCLVGRGVGVGGWTMCHISQWQLSGDGWRSVALRKYHHPACRERNKQAKTVGSDSSMLPDLCTCSCFSVPPLERS